MYCRVRDKLRRLEFAALEIDLSDLDSLYGFDAVKARVIDCVAHKEWLVYPRADDHRTYLNHKLAERVALANKAPQAQAEQQRRERDRLLELEKAQRAADADIDKVFSGWPPDWQATWLVEQLGLVDAVPAFLARATYPTTVLTVHPFSSRRVFSSDSSTRKKKAPS